MRWPTLPRDRRAWVIVAVATVLVLVAATGGWWLWAGPGSTPKAAPDPIGDPRTADPCALLDLPALERFGRTELEPDGASFVSCTAGVRPGPEEAIGVVVTLDGIRQTGDQDLALLPRQQAGDITIYHTRVAASTCSRTVLLPNRFRISFVGGSSRDDGGGLDLCAVVDTAVRQALARLVPGPLPRRPRTEPPNSMLWVDACGLLDENALRSIPRLRVDARDQLSAGTVCEWGDDDPGIADPALVSVFASRDSSISGQPITVDAHRGALRAAISNGPRTFCRATLVQRAYEDPADHSSRYETLNVQVHLNVAAPADLQCAVAVHLARQAAHKLPPPGS